MKVTLQVVTVMLKAISGVAIASRKQTPVDWAAVQASAITNHVSNGAKHSSNGTGVSHTFHKPIRQSRSSAHAPQIVLS